MTKSDERGQREPVAWMAKNEFGHWYPTTNKALADTWRDTEKLNVVPLYPEPPAEAAEVAKAVQAERDAIRAFVRGCDHDMGFDREMGPIGCDLGDGCVCCTFALAIDDRSRAALSPTESEK